MMNLCSFFCLMILFILTNGGIKGQSANYYQRQKRSISCDSSSLLKYTYTNAHTACISPSPHADLETAGVTDEEKEEIIQAHNVYRSSIPATDMTKMSWDAEVEFIAQKWAENCQTNHDPGYKRRIPGRFSLGQNLAWSSNKMTWSKAIKLWYDEINLFTYNGNNVLSQVGHYTQVVWAKSVKIGCGYTYCRNINRHYYACNYGPAGNFDISKPYNQGQVCGNCPGHCNGKLCDCNMVCLNGGTLNLETCTCNCITGYRGPDCALDCTEKSDPRYCLNQYTVAKCSVYSNVPSECPNMCKFCPNAGISVTGQTNGRGVLNSFNPSGPTSGCRSLVFNDFQILFTFTVLYMHYFHYR